MKPKNFKELLSDVKAFIFDVDGVLSTSTIPISDDGIPLRSVNIKDGYALQLAIKKGYHIAIITGGNFEPIRRRFEGLGIKDIYMKSSIKVNDFDHFISKYNIDPANIMYMGDDIPDYHVMKLVGVPVCPVDAAPEIKKISKYTSAISGGNGCVRDVVEQVMKVHGNWMGDEAFGW